MTHRSTTAAAAVLTVLGLSLGACAAPGSGGGAVSAVSSVQASVEQQHDPEGSSGAPDAVAADESELMGNYALLELTARGRPSFIDVTGLCTRVDITAEDWSTWPTEAVLYAQEAEQIPAIGCAEDLDEAVTAVRSVLTGTVTAQLAEDGTTITLTQGEHQAVLERR
ncbi:hypothetical protein AB0E44_04765 [Micrococcus terreus]|uniref:hypothetical protein n=1 Tax=Micrococcus terreus TaxID=574650 RepID=UPI0033DCC3FD